MCSPVIKHFKNVEYDNTQWGNKWNYCLLTTSLSHFTEGATCCSPSESHTNSWEYRESPPWPEQTTTRERGGDPSLDRTNRSQVGRLPNCHAGTNSCPSRTNRSWAGKGEQIAKSQFTRTWAKPGTNSCTHLIYLN